MSKVYVLKADGSSEPMTPVHCKNEDNEIQRILERNPNLMPGEQIDPESPCRWMLIRREMPVPDPSTGDDRYYIDFLFTDQNATPTFVECKRFLDTRARRAVVGQVLEYAANAQHYWSAADLKADAEMTAKKQEKTLEQSVGQLQSDLADSIDGFFNEVERRLKAGDVRIVFFLEEAPTELKRLVEFLNSQMASVEVLLVQAKQYQTENLRIVAPALFGFSEQIRVMKRAAKEHTSRAAATDWDSFKSNGEQKGVQAETMTALRKLYDACKFLDADIGWGRGTVTGSYSPRWPHLGAKAAPFSAYSTGRLELHFPAFQSTHAAKAFSERFGKALTTNGLPMPADHLTTWFQYEPETWVSLADGFVDALRASVPPGSTA